MLRLTFSEEDIKELDYQRYHHPHPRVQRKMEALLLKAKGLPHHQIARLVWECVKIPCVATSSSIRPGALRPSSV
jgi:hypothetical protein